MKNSVLIIGLLCLMAGNSHAINYELGKNEFGFDGGQADGVSGNDFESLIDNTNVYGAHYTRFLTPRFGLGIQADYLDIKFTDSVSMSDYNSVIQTSLFTNTTVNQKIEDVSLMMTGRVNAWTRGIVIPYLSAGIGLNRFHVKSEVSNYTALTYPDPLNPGQYLTSYNRTADSEEKTSISGCSMVGLGLDIMISEIFRIGVEGRYNYYMQTALDETDNIEMYTTKAKASWFF